jgi:hypothetical protein
MKRRILNWLIALDQWLFCTLTLGNSQPNESASAAAWRLEQGGHWAGRLFRPLIDWAFFFDPDHCRKAFDNLAAGKHLPQAYNKQGGNP